MKKLFYIAAYHLLVLLTPDMSVEHGVGFSQANRCEARKLGLKVGKGTLEVLVEFLFAFFSYYKIPRKLLIPFSFS